MTINVEKSQIAEQPASFTARETAELLGIKLDTLYAYVSRGLLASVSVPGSRERRYEAAAVERFRASRGGRGVRPTEALVPVIASAICLIENGRLYYRGRDAIRLADAATLEEVAALLWEDAALPLPPDAPPLPERGEGRATRQHRLIERCLIRLAQVGGADLAALDLSRAGAIRTGRLILGELVACVAGTAEIGSVPAHRVLAASGGLDEAGCDLVRRCLVLLADHELNASTFVARCVASTGATPYAVVAGALAALSGRRHGGASARAEALLRELRRAGGPMQVMAARLARDEALPGMGQPLYPPGDPRAAAIIEATRIAVPAAAEWIDGIAVAALRLTGQYPNVDFALASATTELGLPQGAALGLFLVARTVGWVAHAIEQYETGTLIRPRADYVGKRP